MSSSLRAVGTLLLLTPLALAPACSAEAPDDPDDPEAASADEQDPAADYKADGGLAARVYYRCETATVHPRTGDTWRYQVAAFNNAMQTTEVWVSREGSQPQRFGPITVRKVATNTFSDGDALSFELVQKGAGKSIDVLHASLSLVARSENGWCKAVELPGTTGHRRYDFLRGTAGWANRSWEILAVGPRIVDTPMDSHLKLDLPSDADLTGRVQAVLRATTRCDPLATLMGPGGSTRQALALGWLGLILEAAEIIQCLQGNGLTDRFVPVRAQVGPSGLPAMPKRLTDECGTGPSTLYLVASTQTTTTVLCAQAWEATAAGEEDYLRVRTMSANDFRVSPWVIAVAR